MLGFLNQNPAFRYAAAVGLVFVLLALGIGANFWLTNYEVQRNNQQLAAVRERTEHRWCATLDLLTSVPVKPPADPASNPSREGEYKLYLDFVQLKHDFGC